MRLPKILSLIVQKFYHMDIMDIWTTYWHFAIKVVIASQGKKSWLSENQNKHIL